MPPLIDLTGKKFDKLLVLKRGPNKGRYTAWECQCDCGNIILVRGADLKNGHTKSCGCFKNEIIKEKFFKEAQSHINEKYGHLTILDVTDHRTPDRHILYKCQCDCDEKNIIYKPLKDLKSGHVQSCGCLISKGEDKIKTLLTQHNISFKQQKSFETCRFPNTNALAKFDFFVDNKYIIEFDGKQHFIAYESGWSTKDILRKTQKHDKFKNQWCQKNNIPIIRIPYTYLDNLCLEDLLLNTSTFLVKEENKERNNDNE